MKRVYFLRPVGQLGPIKIGCSKLPEIRLDSMTIWSPVRLELICSVPGAHKDERTLHGMFAKHRVHGEWFGASKELLALIDHCEAMGELPTLPEVVKFPKTSHVGHLGRAKGKREPGTLPPHKAEIARQMRVQYDSGLTTAQIADEHGVHYGTARRFIYSTGITKLRRGNPQRGVADTSRAEAFKARYLAGETLKQIGDAYGVTRERVRQILRKTGVGSLGHRPEHCQQPHELTNAEIRAVELYDAGVPVPKLVADLGLTVSQIHVARRRLGVAAKRQGYWNTRPDDAEITALIAQLYASGASPDEIVARIPHLNHATTIYRYLKKAGVPTRTNKGNFRGRKAA